MDEIIKSLRIMGLRITPARQSIISSFISTESPISASQIILELRRHHLAVNKTTVYREIAFLLKNGLIHEVKIKTKESHYELSNRPHHHHLVCNDCGDIQDIKVKDEIEIINQIFQGAPFLIQNHSLEFYGLCQNCQ